MGLSVDVDGSPSRFVQHGVDHDQELMQVMPSLCPRALVSYTLQNLAEHKVRLAEVCRQLFVTDWTGNPGTCGRR